MFGLSPRRMDKRDEHESIFELRDVNDGLTLELMCVRTIINSFERFYAADKNSADKSIKRGTMILRKKYSACIARELSNRKSLKPVYLDFVLNEHLKELDSKWLICFNQNDVVKKFKEIGHAVEYFEDDGYGLRIGAKILPYMLNLKHLKCREFTVDILNALTQSCNKLEKLEVNSIFAIPSRAMKRFGFKENGDEAFPKLSVITLQSQRADFVDMSSEFYKVKYLLQNLKSLEYLEYEDLPTVIAHMHTDYKNNFIDKDKRYNLTKLFVAGDLSGERLPLHDKLKICSEVCSNVREIQGLELSQEVVNAFSLFPSLEVLKLKVYDIYVNMNYLLKRVGANIISLQLETCKVSFGVILEYCTKLETLTLTDVVLDNATKTSRPTKFNLKELCLVRIELGDRDAIAFLQQLFYLSQDLQVLTLKNCRTSSDFESLLLDFCKRCTLETLYIDGIEDIFWGEVTLKDIFQSCTSLKTLKVRQVLPRSEMGASSLRDLANSLENWP